MKKMSKIMSLILAVLMAISCFAIASAEEQFKIGVCQLVTHDALDAATEGFQQAIKDILGEENVAIDVQNAAGDIPVCGTIVNSFVSKKYDLIMANATPLCRLRTMRP